LRRSSSSAMMQRNRPYSIEQGHKRLFLLQACR
jgi:hypothetical protein